MCLIGREPIISQLPVCGEKTLLSLDDEAEEQYYAWKEGMLIQLAFPDWTDDQRELLMTGTHGVCWEKMFKDMEEE